MAEPAPAVAAVPPKVGFVSLGCPKALTDAERILTQLSAEGYATSKTFDGADLVIVNTCGFIDDAVKESLDTIGEALAENGKVIVTGCLGAKGDIVQTTHPAVLAVTGPHAADEVMGYVHQHLPKPHDPYTDLVPPQGVRLTPDHFAYLKISEGCNHSCTFCIIPSMRGPLVSRPIGDVLQEARTLADAGVRELLVISQDTSAYGVDLKYRTGFVGGRPVRTRLRELCEALGELGVWVRLHYVYPYPHVDNVIPLMAQGKIKEAGEAAEAGGIEEGERDLIESIIDFGDTVAREIMVPRTDMVAFADDFRVADCIEIAILNGLSRFPVYHGNVDDIVGIVYAKDLMRAERDDRWEGIRVRELQELAERAEQTQVNGSLHSRTFPNRCSQLFR